MNRSCSVLGACAFPNCDCPLRPESETPETDALVKSLAMGEGSTWTKAEMSLAKHAHDIERRLSLAQTEIKGHMRIEDDLKAEVVMLNGIIRVRGEAIAKAQARIAVLEKDAARLEAILAIWKAHRADQDAEDPDEVDSYDRVCDVLDAALKDRA